jgi:ubiquinone/menaquinone biosynthesis C-methylase UbiE
MADLSVADVHWGSEPVDLTERSLPSLKARFLVDHIGANGSVLEVGCGDGKLLRTLARHRPALDLHGCDPREPRTAPECFTFHAMTGRLPASNNSFDAVIIFDVLEHVPAPAEMLADVARILKLGGRLIAFVPVEGEPLSFYALFRRLLGADTYEVTKEHIQAFRHNELRALVKRYFRVAEWRYSYHFFGHLMDAAFFAAARTKGLRRFWWNENAYYNDATESGAAARAMNRLLNLGNAIAYHESKLLARVQFTSAGVLFVAEKPPTAE